VAFPTETVYGLGANALSEPAVQRIFEAKGRPRTSPLIVHVSGIEAVTDVISEWSGLAQRLAERFWPGPLTLVLPKSPGVPDIVTAGLPSVGIRMPAHPVALALLRECQLPLAAPSANRFTQLSPTTADHVREGLGDRVDFILDGGSSAVGIESTVLSLVTPQPTILRLGGLSRELIQEITGPVSVATAGGAGAHAAPGMSNRHYSPLTRLLLSKNGEIPQAGRGIYLRILRDPQSPCEVVYMPSDPRQYATVIYGTLHDLDARHLDWIAAELPPPVTAWEAVLDRLRRAAQ
jgi:L-threonylcarbamoyladenylate synthase